MNPGARGMVASQAREQHRQRIVANCTKLPDDANAR